MIYGEYIYKKNTFFMEILKNSFFSKSFYILS